MRRFYIVYRDEVTFEGQIDCTDEQFIERLIKPNKDNIYSYYLWPANKLTEELILQS